MSPHLIQLGMSMEHKIHQTIFLKNTINKEGLSYKNCIKFDDEISIENIEI